MPSFDASIDYLEMLELDLSAGASFSVEQLKEAIRSKRKEWTAQAVNPLYQQQARRNLDLIRGFEKLLSRPEALQDYVQQLSQLHVQRRQAQEREVGNMVRAAVSSRGYMTTRQRELLVQQVAEDKIWEDVVDTVLERLGIEMRSPDRLATGRPELPYEQPALDRAVLVQVSNWLKLLNVASFYELLDLPTYAPIATIRSQAEMQFAKWSRVLPKSTEVVAWEKSLQACLTWLKDDNTREQYNRALHNERIDRFVRRIDLLLAAGKVTRDDQIELTRTGTREFGLSSSVVSRCISARISLAGLSLDRPVSVTVQMQGQTQCTRCYSWSPRQNLRCWSCGGTLAKRCGNPFCRKRINTGSRTCEHCNLRTADGKRFATLISMGDDALKRGDWETAIPAFRTASRLLPTEHVDVRLEQAGEVRALISQVTDQVTAGALSAARESLAQLAQLSPEAAVSGLPTLEELTAQIRRLTAHCNRIKQIDDPVDAAENWTQLLERWSDCHAAYHSLRFLCESLARDGEAELALLHARTLLTLRPDDDTLRRWTVKVQKWQSQQSAPKREDSAEVDDAHHNNGHRNGTNGHTSPGRNGVHRMTIDPALLHAGTNSKG